MPAHRIHTHCQVAQKRQHTDQNLSKSMAASTHRKTADPNKTKIRAIIRLICLIMKEAQHLKKYIKHLADSANFKAVKFNGNYNFKKCKHLSLTFVNCVP